MVKKAGDMIANTFSRHGITRG